MKRLFLLVINIFVLVSYILSSYTVACSAKIIDVNGLNYASRPNLTSYVHITFLSKDKFNATIGVAKGYGAKIHFEAGKYYIKKSGVLILKSYAVSKTVVYEGEIGGDWENVINYYNTLPTEKSDLLIERYRLRIIHSDVISAVQKKGALHVEGSSKKIILRKSDIRVKNFNELIMSARKVVNHGQGLVTSD
jgi:hypothetical protein